MNAALRTLPQAQACGRSIAFALLLITGGCHQPPESRSVPAPASSLSLSSSTIAPEPKEAVPETVTLLPAHRELLEQLGWLEYVDGNIDVVRYYDYQSFEAEDGPAVGLSRYWDGLRIADIATSGRSDLAIAVTLVHEAAHLSGIHEFGDFLDEEAAEAIEIQFLSDFTALRSDDSHQRESQKGLQWQIR